MQFVCLVYGEEQKLNDMTAEQMGVIDHDSLAYDRVLEQSGHLIIAQALKTVKKSKSLRRRGGKVAVTDGPFAETKEQLLGFVMIEAVDQAEALEIAGKIPLADIGTIEVREVYVVPGS
jgi:hypothetical protein